MALKQLSASGPRSRRANDDCSNVPTAIGERAVAAAAGAREAPQCTDKGHEPSDPKDLHSLSEANRDPVRLGHGPLQLVDGAASLVGQDRALDRSRKRLQVPY